MSDEYELLPVVELEKLRQEVAALKQGHVSTAGPSILGLQQSIDSLNSTMNRMMKVFSNIDEELIAKAQVMSSYDDEFSHIKAQNEQIAQGMVGIAEMIKDQQQHPPLSQPVEDVQEEETPSPLFEEPSPPQEQQPIEQRSPQHDSFEQPHVSQEIPPIEQPLQSVQDHNSSPQDHPWPAQTQQQQQQQPYQQDPWEIPSQQSQNPSPTQPSADVSVDPLPFNPEEQQSSQPATPLPPSDNKKGLFGLFK